MKTPTQTPTPELVLTDTERNQILLVRQRRQARDEVVTIAELLEITLILAFPTLDDPTLVSDTKAIVDRIKAFATNTKGRA